MHSLQVAMVFHYNAVDVAPARDNGTAGDSLGDGLYTLACRANHSCRPNCFWYATADGGRVLKAIEPIAEGEELMIDYTLEQMDAKPVHERRARLKAWDFLCECPRCAAYGDDTRSVKCGSMGCNGSHLIHQPTAEALPVLTPCMICGIQPSASFAAGQLKNEAKVAKKLAAINATIDSGMADAAGAGLMEAIMRLQPPHPHHHLAAEVFWVQYELYRNLGRSDMAARCLGRVIECRDAIVSFPSRITAFKQEYLGDMLQACPGATKDQLLDAQEAYRCAARSLLITSGAAHPFSACVARKLATTQLRLPADETSLGLDVCSMCGGRGAPATQEGRAMSKCGRCKTVAYCCTEHQRAHWRAHKKSCTAAAAAPAQ